MAYIFTTNQTPATGAVHVYTMIDLLKSAGWTQQDSSDGTTRATNQVTSGASGTNGLGNNNAWVRLRGPGGVIEIIFQRGTSNIAWRCKFSLSAQFIGGSPSASVTPSATDELIVWGSGTDASPTFTTLIGTDATYRSQFCADNASPYGFYWFSYPIGGGTPTSCFVMDPLSNVSTGDTFNYVFARSSTNVFANTGASLTNINVTSVTGGVMTKVGASTVTTQGMVYYDVGGQVVPGNAGTNQVTGKDDGYPIMYARRATLNTNGNGYKGISTLIKWNGVSRTTGDLFSISSAKDFITAGDCRLPWDGTTSPIQ